TFMSYAGTCSVGVNIDTHAIDDQTCGCDASRTRSRMSSPSHLRSARASGERAAPDLRDVGFGEGAVDAGDCRERQQARAWIRDQGGGAKWTRAAGPGD